MTQADSPNHDADLSEASPSAKGETTLQALAEDWQTVDFPGAISVDAIARDPGFELNLTPPQESVTQESVDLVALSQQLSQENTTLREQLAVLEKELAQGQTELQLERNRPLHNRSSETAQAGVLGLQQAQDLTSAQERVSQLFQELELSHQTAQRQQILVETLTEQLEGSQERIAQLERDCALIQQRYNEQVKQCLHAENTCRDLRTRLHRQQQQTLQFKAALEKSLEVPGAYGQSQVAAFYTHDTASDATISTPPSNLGSSPLIPKNQPVQPWSTLKGKAASLSNFASPLAPTFAKLLNDESGNSDLQSNSTWGNSPAAEQTTFTADSGAADSEVISEAISEALSEFSHLVSEETQDMGKLMSLLFPEFQGQSADPIESPDQASTVVDPSPLIQSGHNLEPTASAIPSTQPESPDLTPVGLEAQDPVWDDLAEIIDPLSQSNPTVPINTEASHGPIIQREGNVSDRQKKPLLSRTAENLNNLSLPNFPKSKLVSTQGTGLTQKQASSLEPVSNGPEVASESLQSSVPAAATQDSLPLLAEDTTDKPVEAAADQSLQTKAESSANSPSPVLQPLKSRKKLKSLAAVELPSFL